MKKILLLCSLALLSCSAFAGSESSDATTDKDSYVVDYVPSINVDVVIIDNVIPTALIVSNYSIDVAVGFGEIYNSISTFGTNPFTKDLSERSLDPLLSLSNYVTDVSYNLVCIDLESPEISCYNDSEHSIEILYEPTVIISEPTTDSRLSNHVGK